MMLHQSCDTAFAWFSNGNLQWRMTLMIQHINVATSANQHLHYIDSIAEPITQLVTFHFTILPIKTHKNSNTKNSEQETTGINNAVSLLFSFFCDFIMFYLVFTCLTTQCI